MTTGMGSVDLAGIVLPNGAGWWVFHWGGLFDSVWAETPPLAHVVNAGRGPDTLCGLPRLSKAAPGGSWGPSLDRLGGLQPGPGEPRIGPCRRCLSSLDPATTEPKEPE